MNFNRDGTELNINILSQQRMNSSQYRHFILHYHRFITNLFKIKNIVEKT